MKFRITSPFKAWESFRDHAHNGVDYAYPLNTPIESMVDGVVTNIVHSKTLGKGVYIKMNDGNTAVFGHLNDFNVKIGELVHKGEIIGLSGSTGHSTGPHLHFAVQQPDGSFINPMPYVEDTTNWMDWIPVDLPGLEWLPLIVVGLIAFKYIKIYLMGAVLAVIAFME